MAAWFAYRQTNATELARLHENLNQSTIQRILSGVSPFPRAHTLNAIATALGISYEQIHQMPPDQDEAEALAAVQPKRIPLIDLQALAQAGAQRGDPQAVIGDMTLHLASLQGVLSFATAETLVLVRGQSDSMADTFHDGDVLLVDRAVDAIAQDGVYALALDGVPYIKRVQRLPDGALLLISDNRKYEALRFEASQTASLRVLGRVLLVFALHKL